MNRADADDDGSNFGGRERRLLGYGEDRGLYRGVGHRANSPDDTVYRRQPDYGGRDPRPLGHREEEGLFRGVGHTSTISYEDTVDHSQPDFGGGHRKRRIIDRKDNSLLLNDFNNSTGFDNRGGSVYVYAPQLHLHYDISTRNLKETFSATATAPYKIMPRCAPSAVAGDVYRQRNHPGAAAQYRCAEGRKDGGEEEEEASGDDEQPEGDDDTKVVSASAVEEWGWLASVFVAVLMIILWVWILP